MSAFSAYLANELLDHVLKNLAFTAPTTIYVGLFTAGTNLETNSQVNEVTGGSYARQTIAFDAAASSITQNTSDVTFPTATANWGTITHACLIDALTTGNILYWTALTASKTVNNGDTFKFLAGDFQVFHD